MTGDSTLDGEPAREGTRAGEASEPPSSQASVSPARDRWVRVWDLPTRVFHWALVCLVACAVFTGFVTPEWWMGLHVWAGYGLIALMVFRLVWGVFGPEYSRVVSFVYPPRDTFEHLRGLLLLRPPHHVGHNPTGALMVFALTGVIVALVVTGLLVLGGEEKQGPLSAITAYSVGSAAKHAHFWLTMLLLALVTAHIAGVVVESVLTHDNLVRAIITGWKKLPPAAPVPTPRPARPLLAVALFAVLAGSGIGIVQWLSRLPPPRSLRVIAENASYEKECGACHYAFNPSLLPAASWAGLMTSLREHFGEDASLDAPGPGTLPHGSWPTPPRPSTRSRRTASARSRPTTRSVLRPRRTGSASTPASRRRSLRERRSAAR